MAKLWCWNCFGRGRELRLTAEPVEWAPGMYESYGVYLECRFCGGTGEIDSEQWNEEAGYWLTEGEQQGTGSTVPIRDGRRR